MVVVFGREVAGLGAARSVTEALIPINPKL